MWSTCSASCGDGGDQYRTRSCLSDVSGSCVGADVGTQTCSNITCPQGVYRLAFISISRFLVGEFILTQFEIEWSPEDYGESDERQTTPFIDFFFSWKIHVLPWHIE